MESEWNNFSMRFHDYVSKPLYFNQVNLEKVLPFFPKKHLVPFLPTHFSQRGRNGVIFKQENEFELMSLHKDTRFLISNCAIPNECKVYYYEVTISSILTGSVFKYGLNMQSEKNWMEGSVIFTPKEPCVKDVFGKNIYDFFFLLLLFFICFYSIF